MTGPESPPGQPGGEATQEHAPLPTFRLFYFFLPETSILRRVRFQIVVMSRFLSEVGQESVTYGALIAVAMDGSTLQAALVGVARLLPAALLGLYGGAVADTLPKRVGLGVGYGIQGTLCLVIPILFGTDFIPILLLVLGVSTINQVVGPAEKAVIPLVSEKAQIGSAAAFLSFTDALATGFGTAAVAPVIVKAWGVTPLFIVSGGFLFLASIRVFSLPLRKYIGVREALEKIDLTEAGLSVRPALQWLAGHRAVGSMILIALLVSVIGTISGTLAPSYVAEVLDEDPANSVYVFAPAGLGALLAMAAAPRLIDWIGERWSAAIGFLIAAASLFSLGIVDLVAPILAPLSPLSALAIFGIDLSEEIRAAGFISLFAGFAASLTAVAVQTYINRRVPAIRQGRVFGLQSVLTNAAALVPLVALGAIAVRTGVQPILVVGPAIVLIAAYGLILLASRVAGREAPSGRDVLSSFWEEPPPAAPA